MEVLCHLESLVESAICALFSTVVLRPENKLVLISIRVDSLMLIVFLYYWIELSRWTGRQEGPMVDVSNFLPPE